MLYKKCRLCVTNEPPLSFKSPGSHRSHPAIFSIPAGSTDVSNSADQSSSRTPGYMTDVFSLHTHTSCTVPSRSNLCQYCLSADRGPRHIQTRGSRSSRRHSTRFGPFVITQGNGSGKSHGVGEHVLSHGLLWCLKAGILGGGIGEM